MGIQKVIQSLVLGLLALFLIAGFASAEKAVKGSDTFLPPFKWDPFHKKYFPKPEPKPPVPEYKPPVPEYKPPVPEYKPPKPPVPEYKPPVPEYKPPVPDYKPPKPPVPPELKPHPKFTIPPIYKHPYSKKHPYFPPAKVEVKN